MFKITSKVLWKRDIVAINMLCRGSYHSILDGSRPSHHQWLQFSSLAQSCLTLSDPMDCSTPGFPIHHQLLEFTQTHVHWISDAVQPSHPLSSPSPPTFNLSQHWDLFKWVNSLHQVAKVLKFQLQHQSSQWMISFRMEALYSQQDQDWELTVTQIMNSLSPNSDLNRRK